MGKAECTQSTLGHTLDVSIQFNTFVVSEHANLSHLIDKVRAIRKHVFRRACTDM
jgi:hypothetical protein